MLRRHERAERAGKIGVLEERIVLEASKSRVVPVSTVHELAFGNELERDAALVPVCSSAAAGAGRRSVEPVSIGSPAEVQGLSAGRGLGGTAPSQQRLAKHPSCFTLPTYSWLLGSFT